MQKSYMLLLKYEIRKLFSLPKIIISALIMLLVSGVLLLISRTISSAGDVITQTGFLTFDNVLYNLLKSTLWLAPLIITAGIISSDKKNFWLRTLFARPIKREEYLFIKLIAASIAIVLFTLIWGVIPMLLSHWVYPIGHIDIFNTVLIALMYSLQGILIVVIATLFSCFLPSFLNAVAIMAWVIFDLIQDLILKFIQTNNPSISIISDFFFPTGFTDNAWSIAQGSGFSMEYFSWGLTALFIFGGLLFYTFSKISLDKGGE